jgi:mRNA-degrading endonuclease RelE of RelBE toxin-antitoxin system
MVESRMAKKLYTIEYAKEAARDLDLIRAFDQRKITQAIEIRLKRQPTKESRTRIKRMEQPFWSEYRLRVGAFRVYYDVDDLTRVVSILRVLDKGRNATEREEQP